MESGTTKALDNFMKSTGFAGTNTVPQVAPTPPFSMGTTGGKFAAHYDQSNPQYAQYAPGQMGPQPGSAKGMVTPNNGLIPGHMPVNAQINPTLRKQSEPYPESDLLDNKPFVYKEQPTTQDWRAVGVGPETDRRSPGKSASSPPYQGRLMPPFTGPIERESKPQDGPFPTTLKRPNGPISTTQLINKPDSKAVDGPGSKGLKKLESMMGRNPKMGAYMFGGATLVSLVMWLNYEHNRAAGFAALLFAVLTVYSVVKLKSGAENQMAMASEYISRPKERPYDVSRAQVYQPYGEARPDFNPYPKPLDSQTDTRTRMEAQGLDQSNVEGPRADYWYKRGPTPANRERIKTKDLMRSASMYNMDEREFDEYMARLDGEAPDQFYQAHPYMSLSAFWEHRQQIDDMDSHHGLSTQPGTYNRKFAYKDPRIQQAGAKTMHLKEPPPGYGDAIGSKVHPWLEPPAEAQQGTPFDTDVYMENMKAEGVFDDMQTKVSAADAGRMSASRQAEDEYYRNMYGMQAKDPEDLPPELEPVPTSREGIAEMMKKRRQREASQRNQETDRMMNYLQQQQGYGYTVLPPHPANPPQVPPMQYRDNPALPPRYPAPNQVPSPNLKQRPVKDMVATPGIEADAVSNEDAAQREFASAFKSTTPTDEVIQQAISQAGRRN